MLWGGKPYVPVGLRVEGTVDAIEQANAAGVKDLLVELPADGRSWPAVFDALKKSESRFFVEINSMAPPSLGVVVEPESYRLAGITAPTRIQATMPGAIAALILLVTADGSIQRTVRVPTDPTGKIDEEVDPGNSVEHTALVYPIMRDARVPDGWDGLDEHRDQILAAFDRVGPAPGLRGLFNPLGSIPRFPESNLRFVPTADRFRLELEVYLKRKYGTQKKVEQAWSVQAPDFTSIAQMTRLVPLWSPKRGVNAFWDASNDHTYSAISRNSQAWSDIQTVFNTALRRRMINFSQAIQSKLGVPVLQTWSGWNGPYEGNAAGLAGVAVRLEGETVSDLLNGASRAASTLSRWDRSGLLMATDIKVGTSDESFFAIGDIIDQSRSLGMRGWFFSPEDNEGKRRIGDEAITSIDRDDWLTPRPTFLNFPESAQNPAMPMQLSGNAWWVPAPLDGNRIDFGRKISGYVMRTDDGDQTVMWSNRDPIKVRLRLLNPKSAGIRSMTNVAVPIKVSKNWIELMLGTDPILVTGPEIPVPQECIDETLTEFATLAGAVPRQAQNLVDDIESFRQITTTLNQNPIGAYIGLRQRLERLRRSLAPMVWVEAENSKDHNFSEVQQDSSACGDNALTLSTKLTPLGNLFRAKYVMNARTTGNQEVWISVKGNPEAVRSLYVEVNNEKLEPVQQPLVSTYGNGFGWVNMGTVNLPSQQVNIEVRTGAPLVGNLSLDVVLLAPAGYKPSGPFLNWYPPLAVTPKR